MVFFSFYFKIIYEQQPSIILLPSDTSMHGDERNTDHLEIALTVDLN